MLEFLIGLFMAIMALRRDTKLYPGRLGTRQRLPVDDPGFVGRILFLLIGLAAMGDGLSDILRHR